MQILTAGSFLNLENAENIEALKFTARRLAEHTMAVVPQNLNAEALENLANDLWQKAEYVVRETERRRLREIFVENFGERVRQLKPEIPSAEIASLEIQQNVSTAGSSYTAEQQSSVAVESVATPDLPKERAVEAQERKDEFLGFVKTDEPLSESHVTETEAGLPAMRGAAEKTEQEMVQTATENEKVRGEAKVATENSSETNPPLAATASDAESSSQTATSAIKTTATKTTAAKEPFEFGKCTVNLSLVLLPSSGDEQSRKAIISAASHNSPPEIEFLEIEEGDDLNEIVAVVRSKLERFKQTLPAKYIEQLRQSKTKTAKKPGGVKPAVAAIVAATTKPEIVQPKAEETIGEQKTQNFSVAETEKNRTENAATKETATAQSAPVAAVPQSVPTATNNVQPSLF